MDSPRSGAIERRTTNCNLAAYGLVAALSVALPGLATAQDSDRQLAIKLQNPFAALITVPLHSDYDRGLGQNGDGWQCRLYMEPVVPVPLSKDWNVISRTILPVVSQDGVIGTGSQTGLSNVLQQFFFSPRAPTNGWICGAGPMFLLPTATNEFLEFLVLFISPPSRQLRLEIFAFEGLQGFKLRVCWADLAGAARHFQLSYSLTLLLR